MAGLLNLEEGSVFAHDFRIIRLLGQGGMASVYEAEQLSTGIGRAVKVMLPELVSDARLRERFAQEARLGGRIESDHVVQVIGAGIDSARGLPWLAMELLTGSDLSKYLDRRGTLRPDEILLVFEQLCHALAAAHTVGIVHRDLKPENVFLSTGRRAGSQLMLKVLDFGIAKIIADARTTGTAALGTPLWMAPEQSSPNQPITPATDVWSLGLVAFRMLTGRHYWLSANIESVTIPMLLREILIEELVPASMRAGQLGCGPQIPARFNSWFGACVARDPAARYADAQGAWMGLRQVLSEAGHGAGAAPSRPPSGETSAPRTPSGSLVAGGGSGWMTTSQGGTSTVSAAPQPRPTTTRWTGTRIVGWLAAALGITMLGLGGLWLVRGRGNISRFPVPAKAAEPAAPSVHMTPPPEVAPWSSTDEPRQRTLETCQGSISTLDAGDAPRASVRAAPESGEEPATPLGGPREAPGSGVSAKRETIAHKPADPASEKAGGVCLLNLNSLPVANVVLDGRPLGPTPQVGVSTPAGAHTVLFAGPGEDRRSVSIRCRAGETKTVAVRLASPAAATEASAHSEED